jgi:hypothetical protein
MRIVESEGGLEGCTGLSSGDRDALEPTETREEGKDRQRSSDGWWLARKPITLLANYPRKVFAAGGTCDFALKFQAQNLAVTVRFISVFC